MTAEELAGFSLVLIFTAGACALLCYGGDQGYVKEIGLFNKAEGIQIKRRSPTPDERTLELRRDCFFIAVAFLTVVMIWFIAVPRP